MNRQEYRYAEIPTEKLLFNPNEAAVRLGIPREFTDKEIDICDDLLRSELKARYASIRLGFVCPSEGRIVFDFGEWESRDLYRNLKGCCEVYLFAVTLGHGVDRLLQRLSVLSVSRHFITDALASAYAEAACDYAEKVIKGNLVCRPRFSPGYGDLRVSVQPQILQELDAQRLLNITLGRTLLMSPTKSITAIMGIKNERCKNGS